MCQFASASRREANAGSVSVQKEVWEMKGPGGFEIKDDGWRFHHPPWRDHGPMA